MPDLLTRVRNGIGGLYLFEFANSSSFDNTGGDGIPDLPMNYRVLTKCTIDDGLGRRVSAKYEYRNGCAWSAFVNGRRESDFFGFGEFKAIDGIGGYVKSLYHNMPYSDYRRNRLWAAPCARRLPWATT